MASWTRSAAIGARIIPTRAMRTVTPFELRSREPPSIMFQPNQRAMKEIAPAKVAATDITRISRFRTWETSWARTPRSSSSVSIERMPSVTATTACSGLRPVAKAFGVWVGTMATLGIGGYEVEAGSRRRGWRPSRQEARGASVVLGGGVGGLHWIPFPRIERLLERRPRDCGARAGKEGPASRLSAVRAVVGEFSHLQGLPSSGGPSRGHVDQVLLLGTCDLGDSHGRFLRQGQLSERACHGRDRDRLDQLFRNAPQAVLRSPIAEPPEELVELRGTHDRSRDRPRLDGPLLGQFRRPVSAGQTVDSDDRNDDEPLHAGPFRLPL